MVSVVSVPYSPATHHAYEIPHVSSGSMMLTDKRKFNQSTRHGLSTRYNISPSAEGVSSCSNTNVKDVGYVSSGWKPGYREQEELEDVVTALRNARKKAAHCILPPESLRQRPCHISNTSFDTARVFVRLARSKSTRVGDADKSVSVPTIKLRGTALSHDHREGRYELAEPRRFETRFRRHIKRLCSGADVIPGYSMPELSPLLAAGDSRSSRALISFHAYKEPPEKVKKYTFLRKKDHITMALRNSIRRVCDNLQALTQLLNPGNRGREVSRIKNYLVHIIKPLRLESIQESVLPNTDTSLESELEKVLQIVKRVPPSRSLLLSLCKVQKLVEHSGHTSPP
jgi:hypothetical protein